MTTISVGTELMTTGVGVGSLTGATTPMTGVASVIGGVPTTESGATLSPATVDVGVISVGVATIVVLVVGVTVVVVVVGTTVVVTTGTTGADTDPLAVTAIRSRASRGPSMRQFGISSGVRSVSWWGLLKLVVLLQAIRALQRARVRVWVPSCDDAVHASR